MYFCVNVQLYMMAMLSAHINFVDIKILYFIKVSPNLLLISIWSKIVMMIAGMQIGSVLLHEIVFFLTVSFF